MMNRHSIRLLACVCIFFLPQNSHSQTAVDTTGKNTITYQNPVFNHDFPDPNLVQAKDGYYYAYSTQASWKKEGFGGAYVIPILRSKNLVQWEVVGDALQKKPDWKSEGGIWAPDAGYYNGNYFLFYSFSTKEFVLPRVKMDSLKIRQGIILYLLPG